MQQTAEHVGATLAAAVDDGRFARLPDNPNLVAAALGARLNWHESKVFNRRTESSRGNLAFCRCAMAGEGSFRDTRNAIRQIASALDRSWGERLNMRPQYLGRRER
jgi:hypothetical protein